MYGLDVICYSGQYYGSENLNNEYKYRMLWQPLIIVTNDLTTSKSLSRVIMWKFHKRTRQGASS